MWLYLQRRDVTVDGGYGRLIRRARNDRGLSQSRLAAKVYVDVRTVSRWETEKTRPSAESMKLLAMVLEIRLEDLEAAVAESSDASISTNRRAHGGAVDDKTDPPETPVPPGQESGRPGGRRLLPRPALWASGLMAAGAVVVLLLLPGISGHGDNPTQAASAESPGQFAVPIETAIDAGAVAKAVLGRDIEPEKHSACGAGSVARGSDWVFGPASVKGVHYDAAYRCSVVGGASGELVFRLDKKYSRVHLVAGFLSTPGAGAYQVQFSFTRDGTLFPMTPFELKLGDTSQLDYSVEGVSLLSIRLNSRGASLAGQASTPVVASLLLF